MCLMDKVEILILRNLIHNEEYVRKVIPFIKADYFEDYNQKVLFEEIDKFVDDLIDGKTFSEAFSKVKISESQGKVNPDNYHLGGS